MFPVPRPEAADLSVLLEPVQGTGRPAARGRRPPLQADSRAAPTSLPRQQSLREAVQVGVALREFGMCLSMSCFTSRASISMRSPVKGSAMCRQAGGCWAAGMCI